jgi:hypothetical protein
VRGAVAVLCIFLVVLVGTVSAVHVHANRLSTPVHRCALCAVAHAGVLVTGAFKLAPSVARTDVLVVAERSFYSRNLVLSRHIRPPPQA